MTDRPRSRESAERYVLESSSLITRRSLIPSRPLLLLLWFRGCSLCTPAIMLTRVVMTTLIGVSCLKQKFDPDFLLEIEEAGKSAKARAEKAAEAWEKNMEVEETKTWKEEFQVRQCGYDFTPHCRPFERRQYG